MTEEVWKDIYGYEGAYQVSSFGRIKALPRNIPGAYKNREFIKKTTHDTYGYPIVSLSKNGKSKTFTIHRLVAKAFIPNPNPNRLKEVNHKDENKDNNHTENLEWCTTQYNLTYGHRLDCAKGERNKLHKLTEEQIKEIRQTYIKGNLQYGSSALGKKYGVSHTAIRFIVRNKTWKHIKEDI